MIREYKQSCCGIQLTVPYSGIGGGVISQDLFKSTFGITDANGKTNTARLNSVSSNVVSVLQAGAFFGALGSAPISCTYT